MKWLSDQNSILSVILVLGILLMGCKEQQFNIGAQQLSAASEDKLPYYGDASFTPNWLNINRTNAMEFHKISDFKLVNQLGDTISRQTFDEKLYVTNFFFTSCPGICPKMTSNMFEVQKAFENDPDVLLLSHSVTPTIDSVPRLKSYADKYEIIANKWHLVTGEKADIYQLARQAYFAENDLGLPVDENDFLHTENILLIDGKGHIRGIYNGLRKASINQLISDISLLKSELD